MSIIPHHTPKTEPDLCFHFLQRYGSAVVGHKGQGLWVHLPGLYSLWHKHSWRRSPLTLQQSHRADNPQTAEQLHQRNSHSVKKVLGSTTDFQPGDLEKLLRNPREYDFGGQWNLITELTLDWGNRLWEGTDKTLCAPRPRRKEQ